MEYGLIFILGLVIGSFLNVCIYRILREEFIVFLLLYCVKCNYNLSFLDLVFVFSYIFFRGKCRYCKEKIFIRYLFIELLNCVLYLIVYF